MTVTAIPSSADICAAIEQVIGGATRPVALHEPLFTGKEKAYVDSCIDEGWVSSAGAFVDRFEKDLAAACEAQHAIVTVNGTAALHITLVALGIKPGEEVLIPSLTFVATANAVMHAGAIPHFVEVEDRSLGVDPVMLRNYLSKNLRSENGRSINRQTNRVVSALMPVHVFGHPCQMEDLRRVAQEFHLKIVEDATEALGSRARNKAVGSTGLAVLSFNGNKIITTGGGGAILTDDAALAEKIKHLTTTAKIPHTWAFEHDAVAWNYRMPNLNAALGCAQLEQLPAFVVAKRTLASRYMEAFSPLKNISILREPENTQSNYWLVALIANIEDAGWRDSTLAALHAAGILGRPVWTPLHLLPMYQTCPRSDLTLTESLGRRVINLPSSVKLGSAHD